MEILRLSLMSLRPSNVVKLRANANQADNDESERMPSNCSRAERDFSNILSIFDPGMRVPDRFKSK